MSGLTPEEIVETLGLHMKPCPCCGGEATVVPHEGIRCKECFLTMSYHHISAIHLLIKKWNLRNDQNRA